MSRHSSGVRTAAGSTTLPLFSIYSGTGTTGSLREIGVFNTTTTAVEVFLSRLITKGTQGAGQAKARHNKKKQTSVCTIFTTHTVAPALGEDLGYRGVLGAAIGAGIIWTFGDEGILIAEADAIETDINGVGVLIENGTGQILQAYVVWDE